VLLGLTGLAMLCCIGVVAAVLLRGYLPDAVQALIPAIGQEPTAIEEISTEAAPVASSTPTSPTTAATEPAPASTTPAPETPATNTPSAEITPTATSQPTLTPNPTAVPTKAAINIEDDFCSLTKTSTTWTLSNDPAPEFQLISDNQCELRFTATNENRSSILIKDPIEIKDGTQIEFDLQVDAGSPQDLMIFRWFEGEEIPADFNAKSSLDVEFGDGKIHSSLITGADVIDESKTTKLTDSEVHRYKIEVKDGLMVTLLQDGEALTTFSEPIYLKNSKGRLIFVGKGQLRSVKITVP